MSDAKVVQGDVLDRLKEMEADLFHCVVTSPPYFGLRDYKLPDRSWPVVAYAPMSGLPPVEVPAMTCGLGLEPTPESYIGHLVLVFREIWRVLRGDGTFFCNLGDSYCNTDKWGGGGRNTGKQTTTADGSVPSWAVRRRRDHFGVRPKNLIGIPWRLALALQADGWYLRSDIVWSKPNNMPSSVKDRPATAHEYVFLLAKQPRYFYDHVAVRVPAVTADPANKNYRANGKSNKRVKRIETPPGQDEHRGIDNRNADGFANLRSVWSIPTRAFRGAHFAVFPEKLVQTCLRAGTSSGGCCSHCGKFWRRSKDRWRADCCCNAPAGCRPGDLDVIGTPTGERIGDDPSLTTGRAGLNRPRGDNEGRRLITRYEQRHYAEQLKNSPYRSEMKAEAGSAFDHYVRTDSSGARPIPEGLLERWVGCGWLSRVGVPTWQPPDPAPCRVLDPFAGAGTTLVVSQRMGLDAVGIELSPNYCDIIRQRLAG